MNKKLIEELYQELISANNEAFEASLFDVAFYALASAVHCAKELENDNALIQIRETIHWQHKLLKNNNTPIALSNHYRSGHKINVNLYASLSVQVETILNLRTMKNGEKKTEKSRGSQLLE